MPAIKHRQEIHDSFSTAETLVNVTILPVDMSKTLIFCQTREGSNDHSATMVTAKLTSTTNVEVKRYNTNFESIYFDIQAIEFIGSVSIQRGEQQQDTWNNDITISSVTLTKSFSELRARGNNFYELSYCSFRHRLYSSTILRINGQYDSTNYAVWQVAEFDEASVQSYIGSISGVNPTDVTISSVTMSESFVMGSFVCSQDIGEEQLKNLRLYDSTTVRIQAYYSASMDYNFYVISSSLYSVQRGRQIIYDTKYYIDITIDRVKQERCLLNIGGQYTSFCATDSAYDYFEDFAFTIVFQDSETIRLEKGAIYAESYVSWEVVEFKRRVYVM